MRAKCERWFEAIDRRQERGLARVEASPLRAAIILVALVLGLHLGGMLLLPPLDRTEVVYAQTARQMLESGSAVAPRFQAEPRFDKPLPVLWLQAASAALTGQQDEIRGYRIPSLAGTLLAVLATFFGVRRLLGARVAFVAASLLATCLVVTVQATLAMPEALMLAATSAAMFALARMYAAAADDAPGFGVAMLFWIALGLGMLVNVLTAPLIALLTVLALVTADRGRIGWLWRAAPPVGVVVMLAVASVWPLALWYGGTLDAALAQWKAEGWHLLLGPQEMKWRVVPGLFLAFLLLGLFPAGLFLAPALGFAWRERTTPTVRFMLAWIVPYLLFLELFTRKTPLYMVQAMLPPLSVLFAIWIVRGGAAIEHAGRAFRVGVYGWLALVGGLVVALWVLPFLLHDRPGLDAAMAGLAAVASAAVATVALLSGRRLAAFSALVATAVLFNYTAIPATFASLRPLWVSSEIRAAVDTARACAPVGEIVVAGHTEPSAVFELGTGTLRSGDGAKAAALFRSRGGLAVVAEAQADAFLAHAQPPPANIACVAAYDFIKSCTHRLSLYTSGPAAYANCRWPERYRCERVLRQPIIGRMCK